MHPRGFLGEEDLHEQNQIRQLSALDEVSQIELVSFPRGVKSRLGWEVP